MTASEQYRNIERTILGHLATLGYPIVPVDDVKFDSSKEPFFVRVTFIPLPEQPQGRVIDGATRYRAARCFIRVMAECYARASGTESSRS